MNQHSFVWCDVETTGLDPHPGDRAVGDLLLEIAVILADDAPGGSCEPVDCYTAVVAVTVTQPKNPETPVQVSYGINGPWVTLDPYVLKMHTDNGLLRECQGPLAKEIGTVDAELCAWLTERGATKRSCSLAGNSVHFDLGFCKVWLPKTAELLSHRVGDVTAMRLGHEAASGLTVTTKMPDIHRAVEDVCASLETYAELRAAWAAGFEA